MGYYVPIAGYARIAKGLWTFPEHDAQYHSDDHNERDEILLPSELGRVRPVGNDVNRTYRVVVC